MNKLKVGDRVTATTHVNGYGESYQPNWGDTFKVEAVGDCDAAIRRDGDGALFFASRRNLRAAPTTETITITVETEALDRWLACYGTLESFEWLSGPIATAIREARK